MLKTHFSHCKWSQKYIFHTFTVTPQLYRYMPILWQSSAAANSKEKLGILVVQWKLSYLSILRILWVWRSTVVNPRPIHVQFMEATTLLFKNWNASLLKLSPAKSEGSAKVLNKVSYLQKYFLHNNIDSTNLNCPTFWEQYGYPVNAPEALVARCCYLAIEAMRKTGNFAQKVWLWLFASFCWLAIGKVKQDLSPDILD